jgi:hypothetical protein
MMGRANDRGRSISVEKITLRVKSRAGIFKIAFLGSPHITTIFDRKT